MGTGIGAGLMLVVVVLGLILAVAWIVLPFALIGTKPLLQQIRDEQRKTNALLERLAIHGGPITQVQ